MSFGRRGVTSYTSGVTWGSDTRSKLTGKTNVFESSEEFCVNGPGLFDKLRDFWAARISSDRLLYPLTCLALGLFLGAGVGAAVAPQLLHAEDAGVYETIRISAAMREAAAHRQVAAPQAHLQMPRFHFRGHVMRAHLPPVRRSAARAPVAETPAPEAAQYASPAEAILNDPTLRPGDTVILQAGARVFRGGKHTPHVADDFVDFRNTTLLTKVERREIDEALGLTLKTQALQAFETKIRTTQASLAQHGPRGALPASGPMVQVLR
jgi:hypothetical protein